MARVRILVRPQRRNLVLEDGLWSLLIARARVEDRSLSSLTRKAIREYLEKRGIRAEGAAAMGAPSPGRRRLPPAEGAK
ncbi:MAG: hypothetical protein A2X36_03490 [Elusimicrobia bacterium GWA2_69_24]|nr:MAG: hypothetical protein A2X36_03490 [Elusimicrobia bacterium GWA2_69_24]HBL16408.1 hypothetical protein [Elusimicrobiota bacterium]